VAKGSKKGKTGQSQGRPQVEDPEEAMNTAMMYGKNKSASKPASKPKKRK
jgi:hypothetical protein